MKAPLAPLDRGAEWQGVVAALLRAETLLLLLHVRPDGDTLGSTLGIGHALEQVGKRVAMVTPDAIPSSMSFLPGVDKLRRPHEVRGPFDAALFLDCGDLQRVGEAKDLLRQCRIRINIDHHLSNDRYGDLNYIDPEASSVGEIAYDLTLALGAKLNREIAVPLYAAIATDTGSFKYENTSARTHRIAAVLLEHGVAPAEVARHVWENRPLPAMRLLQRALASLQVDPELPLAWITLRPEDFAETGAQAEDVEGLVGYPRIIQGVEVAVAFSQEEPGRVKVGLRSNRWADVSRLAVALGGGGHARAAGVTIEGSLPEVVARVLDQARELLRS